jgi:uncharacterized protein DUF4129
MKRSVIAGGATVLGLALLLIATRSGQTRDISKHGQPYHIPLPKPKSMQQANNVKVIQKAPKQPKGAVPEWVQIIAWILGGLIAAAIVTLAVIFLIHLVRQLQGQRWRRDKEDDGDLAEMTPEDVAKALTEAVDETLVTIERGETREAIIACWLRLEDVVADAGIEKTPAETASELTERVLGTHQVSRQTLSRLADLYREARFSVHPLGDDARREAREALEQIRRELATESVPS